MEISVYHIIYQYKINYISNYIIYVMFNLITITYYYMKLITIHFQVA